MSLKQILSVTEGGNTSWLYVTDINTATEVKHVDQHSGSINTTLLGSLATVGRLAWIAWENCIYLSNKQLNLTRVKAKTVKVISTSDSANDDGDPIPVGDFGYRRVCAKYLCNSDDHLMLANLVIDGTNLPLMLVWSDLYDPENFVVSSGTEAGYSQVRTTELEITGLAYSRGYTNIFTKNSIISARYVGYDAGLYQFSNLSTSVGCRFHYSVVQAKDAVFFIGKDNFYTLDGTSLSPIGYQVWKLFSEALYSIDDDIPGFLDEAHDIVYWQFKANGSHGTISGNYYHLMYNYREQKWSLRDSEGILDRWQTLSTVVTAITCDELPNPCSTYTQGCDTFVRSFSYTKLFLSSGGFLEEIDSKKDGVNGSGRNFFLETGDLAFTATDTMVHLDGVRLFMNHSDMLGAEAVANEAYFEASIGYKNNSSDDFKWTDYVKVSSSGFDLREINFRFRKYNISGKVFRLRLRAKELGTSFLNTISTCQFSIDIPDEQEANFVTR